jgi:hypothetical protein
MNDNTIVLVHTFRLFYHSQESKGVPGQLSKEVSGVMYSIILLPILYTPQSMSLWKISRDLLFFNQS